MNAFLRTRQVLPALTLTDELTRALIKDETHHLVIVGREVQGLVDRLIDGRVENITQRVEMQLALRGSSRDRDIVRLIISVRLTIDRALRAGTSCRSTCADRVISVSLTAVDMLSAILTL